MITAVVYTITHTAKPNDVYVGQTTNYRKRISSHRCQAKKKRQLWLYWWWNARVDETGTEPEFTILVQKQFDSRSEAVVWLNQEETLLIRQYRSNKEFRCLNSNDGGGGRSEISEETRVKISRIHKGKPKSKRHRERIGLSNRGRVMSLETRTALRKANLGRKPTAQSLEKMRSAQRKVTPAEVQAAVQETGSRRKAAKLLGVARSTIWWNLRCAEQELHQSLENEA